MAKDPVFLILKPTAWMSESEWENILGAAVKNPLSPTDDYEPDNPLSYNKNPLVESNYDGFILQDQKTSSLTFELDVKGLGKLRWAKGTHHEVDLHGKKVYIKRIRRHSEFWKRITTESDDFREVVPEWVNDKRWGKSKYQVCQVVGLLICQDVVVATSDEDSKNRQAKGEIPLGTVAEYVSASQGAPIPTGGAGNVSSEISQAALNRTYFEARGSGKWIFALELKIISSKKGKLILTDKAPDSNRQLGQDGEVDADDLLLRDPELVDWEELLSDSDPPAPEGEEPLTHGFPAGP
jgi:hypothetical protein